MKRRGSYFIAQINNSFNDSFVSRSFFLLSFLCAIFACRSVCSLVYWRWDFLSRSVPLDWTKMTCAYTRSDAACDRSFQCDNYSPRLASRHWLTGCDGANDFCLVPCAQVRRERESHVMWKYICTIISSPSHHLVLRVVCCLLCSVCHLMCAYLLCVSGASDEVTCAPCSPCRETQANGRVLEWVSDAGANGCTLQVAERKKMQCDHRLERGRRRQCFRGVIEKESNLPAALPVTLAPEANVFASPWQLCSTSTPNKSNSSSLIT